MIDKDFWLKNVTKKLQKQFDRRLLYVGLQGSYARGENTEASDFDLVVLLDKADAGALRAYKKIISSMPESEKACGFIGGAAQLKAWPKSDLLQFSQETQDYLGTLANFLPKITKKDVACGVKSAAANIYHAACHIYLQYGENAPKETIKELYKSASFVVQALCFVKTGKYVYSKKDLPSYVKGADKEIISAYLNRAWDKKRPKELFDKIIAWSADIISLYK